jgi:parallel beta-helix repeat protein
MSLTKVSYSMIQGAVFNVLDYGADPTGSADSTSAIQAAINAAQNGVSTVYFPAGTYKTSSSLNVTRPLSIVGAGSNCTNIKPTSAITGPCLNYGVVGDVPRPGYAAVVSHLCFDGTDTTAVGAHGIVTWCSHTEFSHNIIKNFNGYGIYFQESWSNILRHNWIYGNNLTNVVLADNTNSFLVDSNYILNSNEHGILITGANKAVIQNNDIEQNNLFAIRIVQAGVQAMRECSVENNYFELNGAGLGLGYVVDIIVDRNGSEISRLVIANNYHETVARIQIDFVNSAIVNNNNATLYFGSDEGANVTTFNQPLGNYDSIVDNLTYSSYVAQDRTDGYQVFGRIAKFRVFSKNAGVTTEIFNARTAGSNAAGYLGGSLQMKKIAAADAQTDSIYISVADGKLYFKDAGGTSYALY